LAAVKFVLPSLLVPLLLCQCSLLPGSGGESVIYALAPQEALPSPLEQPLTAAAPPVVFARDRYDLTSRQQEALKPLAAQWEKDATPLLILGFAKRGLPTDYARSLSQRRAEAVREALINEGLDAALLHSAGYGHDQPKLGSGDEVKLFTMPAPAPTPAPGSATAL
jgi:outer membrane protein OmpA-like peptidoglycan-associated protein